MPVFFGKNEVANFKLGSARVAALFFGPRQVWVAGGPIVNSLTGTVLGSGALAAAMVPQAFLAGQVVGSGALTGVVTARAGMSGAVVGSGALTGVVTARAGMSGAVVGSGALTGVVTVRTDMSGAVVGSGALTGVVTSTSSGQNYDPDAQAYFTAMTVQPDATRKGQLDTFIKGLKTDGIWTKLDWLLVMAAQDEQAGRLNAKNPAKAASAMNTPTFKPGLGFAGGNSSYLAVGEAWSASGNQFIRDNAQLTIRMTEEATVADTLVIGSIAGFGDTISVRSNNGAEQFRVNGGNGTGATPSASKLGTRTVSRTAPTVTTYYVNGQPNGTNATASGTPSTGAGSILRVNSSYGPGTAGLAASGSGLTGAEALALHDRIQTLFTAMGLT